MQPVLFIHQVLKSSILILDGLGEEFTGGFYIGQGKNINVLKNLNYLIHLVDTQLLLNFSVSKVTRRKVS